METPEVLLRCAVMPPHSHLEQRLIADFQQRHIWARSFVLSLRQFLETFTRMSLRPAWSKRASSRTAFKGIEKPCLKCSPPKKKCHLSKPEGAGQETVLIGSFCYSSFLKVPALLLLRGELWHGNCKKQKVTFFSSLLFIVMFITTTESKNNGKKTPKNKQ